MELEFRLRYCTVVDFKCIIKREVVIFPSFRKNKETKCISLQISKKEKSRRATISLSKMRRSKIFVRQQNLIRTLEIDYKVFDNSHLKFGKRKKANIKKLHFRRPVDPKTKSFHELNLLLACQNSEYFIIRFYSYYAFSLNQVFDIREV